MKKFGYEQSHSDHTLFLKKGDGQITCLIIYVGDMVITGNNEREIKELNRKLFMEFEMKDLGNLKYFLGIEVFRSKKGIFINQKKYVLDLLAEVGMLDCKPVETSIVANHKLQTTPGEELAYKEKYQKLVGKLIYLYHTRPNISYAVGVVCRFMHLPQTPHMEAVVRILRYLKGTSDRGVFFGNNHHLDLVAYTDADWAGNRDSRKSTSGYFTLVGGNLVTWRSKKPKVVALSRACKLFCDNKAAIDISENPVQHDRTKHVEIDKHFIKEKLEKKSSALHIYKQTFHNEIMRDICFPIIYFNKIGQAIANGISYNESEILTRFFMNKYKLNYIHEKSCYIVRGGSSDDDDDDDDNDDNEYQGSALVLQEHLKLPEIATLTMHRHEGAGAHSPLEQTS
ncbi:uncharacterized mitochondrial protein AtMg00810-like [Amaranthus tricolor]|uniref:uncharacterized mitochondrial protein AtMg00810-like n=1 Tax=Amaranthus tricolor TaxID=29722 RepID=UPI00258E832F|nr:uncharacterized mitochondrial protein AtMg00810-like [Amaranthus tricolor]